MSITLTCGHFNWWSLKLSEAQQRVVKDRFGNPYTCQNKTQEIEISDHLSRAFGFTHTRLQYAGVLVCVLCLL